MGTKVNNVEYTYRKPAILKEEYPKAFFFRQTESIENYIGYDDWSKEFCGLMGIMGKALAEEKGDRTKRSTAFYSRFKREHPDQIVLLHYNGNACDPRYETRKCPIATVMVLVIWV